VKQPGWWSRPGDLLRQGHGYDLFNGGPILFGGLDQSPPLVGAVADHQVLADQVTEFDSCFAPILKGLKKWLRHQFPTLSQGRNRDAAEGWKLIPGYPVEHAAGRVLADATPLLEEERYPALNTVIANRANPLDRHRASAGTTLPADDHPRQPPELHVTEILQQGLHRKERHGGAGFPEMLHPRQSEAAVIDADAPPDVLQLRGEPESPPEQIPQALGPFGNGAMGSVLHY
jgi:hypothetical protein